MELGLIILMVAFFVVAFLILKFIKKVIFGVISVFFLFILLIGGIIGLVYIDLNQLMENENYDLQIIYSKNDKHVLGVNLPIINKKINKTKISGFSVDELESEDMKNIKKDDNKFVIIVNENLLKKIINEEEFSLKDIENLNLDAFSDFNLSLKSEDILTILNSEDEISTTIAVLFANNNVNDKLKESILSVAEDEIISQLKTLNISLKEALFLKILSQGLESKDGILTLYEAFDSKELEVYPNRLSFSVLRILPRAFFKEKLISGIED